MSKNICPFVMFIPMGLFYCSDLLHYNEFYINIHVDNFQYKYKIHPAFIYGGLSLMYFYVLFESRKLSSPI